MGECNHFYGVALKVYPFSRHGLLTMMLNDLMLMTLVHQRSASLAKIGPVDLCCCKIFLITVNNLPNPHD